MTSHPITILVLGVDCPVGAATGISYANPMHDMVQAMGLQHPKFEPVPKVKPERPARNSRCLCGSGKKFKACCLRKS